jgi:hypothetical protein
MIDDLAQLLRAADGGGARPDLDDITRRGRRKRAVRATAAVTAALVAVVGGAGIVASLGSAPTSRIPVIGEPGPVDATPQELTPSQSLEDAARDGVIDEIAVLPFDLRVQPYEAGTGSIEQRAVTEEGVWVASRPNWNALEPRPMVIGDEAGRYGRDFFATSSYGEVILLDADEREILRAYPFPDAGPQALLVTDDAVYCTRQGDGGLPGSMLCRIDRTTLEVRARYFPFDDGSHFLDPAEMALPEHWVVDEPFGRSVFGDFEVRGDTLYSVGQDGSVPIDPVTLALLDEASDDPAEVFEVDQRMVEGFLAFAETPDVDAIDGLPLADEVAIGLADQLHRTLTGEDRADPTMWGIDAEFRGRDGTFSALDLAAEAGPVIVSVGAYPHCASPPQPPPVEVEDLRRVSLQPADSSIDSCLEWWTIDLFVGEDGRIAAVTLDLYEP